MPASNPWWMAFKDLASAFGTKSTTKIVGKDTCMGFDKFSDNTTVNVVECLPDQNVGDFVSGYFHDLAWAFGGDLEKMKAELLLWTYAKGTNLSYDGIQFTNSGDFTVRMLKVFKNHDGKLPCSHWAIVEYGGVFALAPDLIYWEKSSSSWVRLQDKKTRCTRSRCPTRSRPRMLRRSRCSLTSLPSAAWHRNRGLNYTWPQLPGCPKDQGPLESWSWATTTWSNCSKPCGGGRASRSVFCISDDGQTDPSGMRCSGAKPASSQPCNEIPCTGKFLVDVLKIQVDNLLRTLPTNLPAESKDILQDAGSSGGHDVVSVPPDQVKTVQNSWTVTNSWPVNITNEFDAIIAAKSEQYQAFSFMYSPSQAVWTVILGAARNFNGTVDMAYIEARGTGSRIQQHYGNEKTLTCPAQGYVTYGIPDCGVSPPNCGRFRSCPGSGGLCPRDCACSPCQCGVTSPSFPNEAERSRSVRLRSNAGYWSTAGDDIWSLRSWELQQPWRSVGTICMFPLPISQQTFDFGGCRDPGHLAQCNKPLTEAQVQVIQEALEATARPQLPSHLDLLAVQLKQPPPYPQMPQAEILVWV